MKRLKVGHVVRYVRVVDPCQVCFGDNRWRSTSGLSLPLPQPKEASGARCPLFVPSAPRGVLRHVRIRQQTELAHDRFRPH